ncbi:MAG TPA: DUF1501 domain-containing protein [Albitalea sp.]|uniref:DUF1501 domain-containing protein n=1 Tax=Piscinibacter sp. TaxID=1903157 RepID=UPI002ED598C0
MPAGVWPATAPAPDYKVLEVFLYGGMSCWENFYFRDLAGTRGYRGFQTTGAALQSYLDLHFNGACAGAPSATDVPVLFDGSDSSHRVFLAPSTRPVWGTALFDRMRVIVLQHDLLPHEAAIPYALTGFRLGNPKLAGLGAAIQRRAIALEELKPVATRRVIPFSYVMQPVAFFAADNLLALTATGQHPGSSRPVVIASDSTSGVLPMLLRPNASSAGDQLFDYYRAQYRDWMRFAAAGDPVRSRGLADYQAAAANLLIAPSLHALLSASPLTSPPAAPLCAQLSSGAFPAPSTNATHTGIRVAAHLLAEPTNPARYVGVVDSGLMQASGGGAYDSHGSGQVPTHAVNLLNVLSTLRSLVDSGGLDLTKTLVVLTTEFGRSPFRSSGGSISASSNGRDHWPRGYVNVLIGGPIPSTAHKVVGRIQDGTSEADPANGVADPANVYNCSDVRAAVLMAAGVFPLADGLFGTTDFTASLTDPTNHDETARNIRRTILGVPD